MKNRGIFSMVMSIILSVLLVFSIIGTFSLTFAGSVAKNSDFLKTRLSVSGTYASVYSDLMKKYDEISVQTSVPADVYKSAVSEKWVYEAIDNQTEYAFNLLNSEDAVSETDYSAFEEKITEYFEKYAAENHVMKDDVYNQRLASSVENAKAVTASVIDVFHVESVRKTSLWPLAVKYRPLLPKFRNYAVIADVILIILLIVFRNPVYWTGASLFASGLLMGVPAAYVRFSGMILKFTIKDYTVFTLITETLTDLVNLVMTTGFALAAAGLILVIVSVIRSRKKA